MNTYKLSDYFSQYMDGDVLGNEQFKDLEELTVMQGRVTRFTFTTTTEANVKLVSAGFGSPTSFVILRHNFSYHFGVINGDLVASNDGSIQANVSFGNPVFSGNMVNPAVFGTGEINREQLDLGADCYIEIRHPRASENRPVVLGLNLAVTGIQPLAQEVADDVPEVRIGGVLFVPVDG